MLYTVFSMFITPLAAQ